RQIGFRAAGTASEKQLVDLGRALEAHRLRPAHRAPRSGAAIALERADDALELGGAESGDDLGEREDAVVQRQGGRNRRAPEVDDLGDRGEYARVDRWVNERAGRSTFVGVEHAIERQRLLEMVVFSHPVTPALPVDLYDHASH